MPTCDIGFGNFFGSPSGTILFAAFLTNLLGINCENGMAKVFNIKDHMKRCFLCEAAHAEIHHIKTRGAGGPDVDWNRLPLCRECHQNMHRLGVSRMLELWPKLEAELVRRGIGIIYLPSFKLIWPRIPDDIA